MTTETVIGSTTNGDDKVKPHESYKNDLDVLFKKYQLLASRKPTTWRGHHDSSPDPKTAAQYYEALIRLTQLFIATSKIPLPSEKVEDLESSKKIENLETWVKIFLMSIEIKVICNVCQTFTRVSREVY